MRLIKTACLEVFSLFVDDGSFVVAVLAWVLGVAICRHLGLLDPRSAAVLLFLGLLGVLAENVRRTARTHAANHRAN